MFPGLTTKLSEQIIALTTNLKPTADILSITDTTSTTVMTTMVPNFGGGFSGIHIVINRSGANITTVTTGNIATAITIGQNVAVIMVFSKALNKFVVGALA